MHSSKDALANFLKILAKILGIQEIYYGSVCFYLAQKDKNPMLTYPRYFFPKEKRGQFGQEAL